MGGRSYLLGSSNIDIKILFENQEKSTTITYFYTKNVFFSLYYYNHHH